MSLQKINEQVEFYFSDSNYAKDKFLQDTANQNNKCIPISILLSFNRMKMLNATIENVKEAVKESTVVEIIDDMLKKIETKEYLEYLNDPDLSKKIVYMKGFKTNMTLDDLKETLSKYCKPVKILMRRNSQKDFKGSAFVEFATFEEAEKVLDLKIEILSEKENDESEAKRAKTDPEFIKIMRKSEYLDNKKVDSEATKNEKFVKKIKDDFVEKLFIFETKAEKDLSISEIKSLVKQAAFVDIKKKSIRMKYREDWEEKTFENEKDGTKIIVKKMPKEEAEEYVKSINIKKVSKKN